MYLILRSVALGGHPRLLNGERADHQLTALTASLAHAGHPDDSVRSSESRHSCQRRRSGRSSYYAPWDKFVSGEIDKPVSAKKSEEIEKVV